MSKGNHFPIPNIKNGVDINNIIFPSSRTDIQEEFHYNRRLSRDVQLIKSQYFIIEDELLNTFDYVFPTKTQLNVFSPKYDVHLKEETLRDVERLDSIIEEKGKWNYEKSIEEFWLLLEASRIWGKKNGFQVKEATLI